MPRLGNRGRRMGTGDGAQGINSIKLEAVNEHARLRLCMFY